jgi:hypothetical protein
MHTGKTTGGQLPHGKHSPCEELAGTTELRLAVGKPTIFKAPRQTRRSCQRYVRQRLIADLPAIADSLLRAARCGGVAELKMLVQLSGLDEEPIPRVSKPRTRSFADILMDHLRKETLNDDGSVGQAGPDG